MTLYDAIYIEVIWVFVAALPLYINVIRRIQVCVPSGFH